MMKIMVQIGCWIAPGALAAGAMAKTAHFKCSGMTDPGPGTVHLQFEVQPYGFTTFDVPLTGPLSDTAKRDAILAWMGTHAPQFHAAAEGSNGFMIPNLYGGNHVTFSPGD